MGDLVTTGPPPTRKKGRCSFNLQPLRSKNRNNEPLLAAASKNLADLNGLYFDPEFPDSGMSLFRSRRRSCYRGCNPAARANSVQIGDGPPRSGRFCCAKQPLTLRAKVLIGLAAAAALYVVVFALMLYSLYSGLPVGGPKPTLIRASDFCADQWVFRGKAELSNKSPLELGLQVKSLVISDKDGHPAFRVVSQDTMAFKRYATSSPEAEALVTVLDPARAGTMLSQIATVGAVDAQVDAEMHLSVSTFLYYFSHTINWKVTQKLSMDSGAALKYCNGPISTCSTVEDKQVQRIGIPVNSAEELVISLDFRMSWYMPWSTRAELPATEWVTANEHGQQISHLSIAPTMMRATDATANIVASRMNVTVPYAFAGAARDAFSRTMEYSALAVTMRGSGRGMEHCPKFRDVLKHFSYTIYDWTPAMNATYNKNPTAELVNPLTGSKRPASKLSADMFNATMLTVSAEQASVRILVNFSLTDGVLNPGPTAQRAALLSHVMPDMAVDVYHDSGLVMTADMTLEGCWPDPHASDCDHVAVIVRVKPKGTGALSTIVINDMGNSLASAFSLKARALDKALLANVSVLTTVWSGYTRVVEANYSAANGSTSKFDGIVATADDNTIEIDIEPRLPDSIFLIGPYTDAVKSMLAAHPLALFLGDIKVQATCSAENLVVANAGAQIYGSKDGYFKVNATVDVNALTTSPCLSVAENTDKNATLPPFLISVHVSLPGSPGAFAFSLPYAFDADDSGDLDLGAGLKTSSICKNPVSFSMVMPAPSMATMFGDIDVVMADGQLIYQGGVAATIDTTLSPGPLLQVRDSQILVSCSANITRPELAGRMLDTWYSTWHDLVATISGKFTIKSAKTNPVRFNHQFQLSHTFKAANGKTLSTDVFQGIEMVRSDDQFAVMQIGMVLNLSKSLADGWGFPPFDTTIPEVHWNWYADDGAGGPRKVIATVTTSAFHGAHDSATLGPVNFTGTVSAEHEPDFLAFVRSAVSFELNCTDRAHAANLYMVGDGPDADKCLFQEGVGAVNYWLLPSFVNNTVQEHNMSLAGEISETTVNSMTAAVIFENTSDATYLNMLPGIPSMNISIHSQFFDVEPRFKLLASMAFTSAATASREAVLSVQIDRASVAALINEGWENLIYGIDTRYSLSLGLLENNDGQKILSHFLNATSSVIDECYLNPPAPPMELFVGAASAAPPPFDMHIVEANKNFLVLQVGLAIGSLVTVPAELAHTSFLFGEMQVSLHAADKKGAAIMPPILEGEVVSLTTERIVVNLNITASTGVNSEMNKLLAAVLMHNEIHLVGRIQVLGKHLGVNSVEAFVVDTDLTIPESVEDPCANATATGGGGGGGGGKAACPSGWMTLQPGFCLKLDFAARSAQMTIEIDNPVPIELTVSDVHLDIYASTNSASKVKPAVIATGSLSQPSIKIPANASVVIPVKVDLSTKVGVGDLAAFGLLAYQNELNLAIRNARAAVTIGGWTSVFAFADPTQYDTSIHDCTDDGKHFATCETDTGSSCRFVSCTVPIASHGPKVTCQDKKCMCAANSCLFNGVCTKDLGPPPATHKTCLGGEETGLSCRYSPCRAGTGTTCTADFECKCQAGDCWSEPDGQCIKREGGLV